MKKIIFAFLLSMAVSIVFGQVRISTNGHLGTTSNIPLIFDVNSIKSGATGSSSSSNVSFGYEALLNVPSGASCNTAMGFKASRNTTGNHNTSYGYEALSANTTGTYNTAAGFNALKANTTASWNTAFGSEALTVNTTGSGNNAFGSGTLLSNTTGGSNVAVGNNALQYNTTGNYNISVGLYSLSNNTTGSGNIAIGNSVLDLNTTGSNNTVVGIGANVNAGNLSNVTLIGNGAQATGSNQIRLGNTSVVSISGQVGWTTFPSDGRAKKNVRTNVPGLSFINSLQPVTYNLNLDAVDDLLKTEKTDRDQYLSQEALDQQKAAREAKEKQIYSGFIAQEVEKSAQSIGYDFSGIDVDENGIYGLRYAEFVVPLVKAVQELSQQNEELKEQISELREEVDLLKLTTRSATSTDMITDQPKAILYQNAPNPFSEKTVIKYELLPNTSSAYIYIFNMQGALMKQIPVNVHQSNITINASELAAGMYLYSLIIDGKEVDTKRMILTK
jgi:hypothetical protein